MLVQRPGASFRESNGFCGKNPGSVRAQDEPGEQGSPVKCTVGILDFILRANRKPVLSSNKGVSGANVRFLKIQWNMKTGLDDTGGQVRGCFRIQDREDGS